MHLLKDVQAVASAILDAKIKINLNLNANIALSAELLAKLTK